MITTPILQMRKQRLKGVKFFSVNFEHAKITSTPGPLHLLFPVCSALPSNLHKAM